MYIISYHIISYHIISYHTISHIISYHTISYHTIPYLISYHIISYHIISYHTISHIISYHIIPYHIIPYHISYHIISYHIISVVFNLIHLYFASHDGQDQVWCSKPPFLCSIGLGAMCGNPRVWRIFFGAFLTCECQFQFFRLSWIRTEFHSFSDHKNNWGVNQIRKQNPERFTKGYHICQKRQAPLC